MSKLKRIRLPGGKWVTRKLSERESDPAALAKAKPEEIWTAAEGRRILVRDMETQHLLAAMHMLVNRASTEKKRVLDPPIDAEMVSDARATEILYPIYKTMCAELKRRLEGKPEPEPETRNRAIELED